MNKKLIALDLDGTLLDNNHKINKETKEYLINLQKQNFKIIISTGRTFTAAKRYHNELNLNTPLVSCNGGFIYDPINKEILNGHPINKKDLIEIFHILEKHNSFFQFYTADTIYSTEIKYLLEAWTKENKHLDENSKINIKIINNSFEELNSINESIFKLLVIEEDEKKYKMLWDKFDSMENIEIVSSFKGAIDIMVKGISKGEALKFMANYLKIPMEDTLAIGDNNNDATMLKSANIGIAMENATPLAKDNANFITSSNENNGVLKALKKHL